MTRLTSGVRMTLAGNPSADLDQCANDPSPSSHADGCDTSASSWVNGNLGASKAVYLEGDSVPYRMRFDNLPLGTHTVTIEWDTTKSGKHAIDYLKTYNATVGDASPCLGVSPCSSPTQFTVPSVPGLGVPQASGAFTMWGGSVTSASAYSSSGDPTGDSSQRITLTFTAAQANPVLAWAGHIADHHDWGAGNSAVSIPGSPYHMRLIDLDGSGGNQDRSLSADAVIFPATITITKHATPTAAGATFPFTASSPLSNFNLDGSNSGSGNVWSSGQLVTFQTYTIGEGTLPSGWSFDSASCSVTNGSGNATISGASAQLPVEEGDDWACTFNNTRATSLTLVKQVTNDNGGTAAASAWTLHADASGDSSSFSGTTGVSHAVTPSVAYTLSETGGPSGYTGSAWSCDGGQQSGSSITLGTGDAVTCTITNDDNTPHLHLRKLVTNDDGGSTSATAWTLTATRSGDSSPTLSGSTPVDSNSSFTAGTYALAESGPSGYTASSWSCTGGGSLSGSNVTVGLGDDVTCTITNNDDSPQLKLVKTVTNDDGGTLGAADFNLQADASAPNDGRNFSSKTAAPTFHNVFAGTAYTLSEDAVAGYSTTGHWSCDGGTLNAGENAITLSPGAQVTCTLVNTDDAPQLKLVKHVTNDDGGTAGAGDWTLGASAGAPSDGRNFTSATDSPTFHDVFAGAVYTLSETGGPSGYTLEGWTCDGGTMNDAKTTVTVPLGGHITCTVTNNDDTPQLKLVKEVVNNDGGSAGAGDWALTATAGSPDDGRNFTSKTASPTFHDVFAGTTYTLAETDGPDGYTSEGWSCDAGTMNEAKTTVTVPLGTQVTCTITNNDNGPQLKLVKDVVNDNGGTATADQWTLHADADSGSASRDISSATAEPTFHDVFAGVAYNLSETGGPDGYSSTGRWTCDGGTMNEARTQVTVALGGRATCTITNDDVGPTITIQKRLLPSGDAGTFTFTIDPDAESPIVDDNGGKGYGNLGSTGPITVDTGSHTITESGAVGTDGSGYASTWSCSNEQSGSGTTIELSRLALGDNVTCTFTNTHLATLIVRKIVDNGNGGGSKGPGDFTLKVTGPGGFSMSGAGSSSGTTYNGLIPGTYHVAEDSVSGYNLTSITGCLLDGSVILAAGQTVTCTLTNTSNAPPPPPPPPPPAPRIDLSITKTGAPSPQTVGKAVTWTMVVTNNGPNDATGVTVGDALPAGTTYVSSSSSQGTCAGGALLSCTIGNLSVGSSVTITLVTTATVTGTITNTATVVGNEAETNTANNTASANVPIIGVFKPPVVQKPACTALFVSPKQLTVGKQHTLKIKVTQRGKAVPGVRVRIKGSTITLLTAPSNKQGLVKRSVKPMKAGIVTFTPVATKQCNNPRIGVIGVFTPPVTG